MKLVLERIGDKGFSLMANELAGDENFVAYRQCFFECLDSERWSVNRIITEEWEKARAQGAHGMLFNQFTWAGTTGWEFWTDDQEVILSVCMAVSTRLGVELQIGTIAPR